jgi:hypothetical protein
MRFVLSAFVALTLMPVAFLSAQTDDSTTRVVQGVVTDVSNSPVAQAVVQLKNTKTLNIRSFITGADGEYHFAGLDASVEYELKATHEGMSSGSKNVSVFNSKKVVVVNLKLNKQ